MALGGFVCGWLLSVAVICGGSMLCNTKSGKVQLKRECVRVILAPRPGVPLVLHNFRGEKMKRTALALSCLHSPSQSAAAMVT